MMLAILKPSPFLKMSHIYVLFLCPWDHLNIWDFLFVKNTTFKLLILFLLFLCQYGGFSKFPGQLPDLYHSYYGFSAFSMLEEPGLIPICVELGIADIAAIGHWSGRLNFHLNQITHWCSLTADRLIVLSCWVFFTIVEKLGPTQRRLKWGCLNNYPKLMNLYVEMLHEFYTWYQVQITCPPCLLSKWRNFLGCVWFLKSIKKKNLIY